MAKANILGNLIASHPLLARRQQVLANGAPVDSSLRQNSGLSSLYRDAGSIYTSIQLIPLRRQHLEDRLYGVYT